MNINAVLDVQLDDDAGSDEGMEPVTTEEGRSWLHIDGDYEDDLIDSLITTARMQCEHYLNISLVPKTVTAILENGLGNISLPYGPVNEVASVYDTENDDAEIDSAAYSLTGILFKRLSTPDYCKVKVVYSTGYDVLPKHFATSVKQQLAWLYENRGDADKSSLLSPIVLAALKPFRRVV